jgi:hypothetical protein
MVNIISSVLETFLPVVDGTVIVYTAADSAADMNTIITQLWSQWPSVWHTDYGVVPLGTDYAGPSAPGNYSQSTATTLAAGYGAPTGVVAWFQKVSADWTDSDTWTALTASVNSSFSKL